MKIQIAIPVEHTVELQYIVDLLFGDFLKLDYELETRPAITDVLIQVGEKRLVFQDHFFSKILDGEDYRQEKYLPEKARFLEYKQEHYPIVYGHDYFYRDERMIVCGLDIFASLFFLLTAWEEEARAYLIDEHYLFPFNATWIWKSKLHERDILKEYIELLTLLLEEVGMDMRQLAIDFPKPKLFVLVEDLSYFKKEDKEPDLVDILLNPIQGFRKKKKWKKMKQLGRDPWDNLSDWYRYAKEKEHQVQYLVMEDLPEEQVEKVKAFSQKKDFPMGIYLLKEENINSFSDCNPVCFNFGAMSLQAKWRFLSEHNVQSSLSVLFNAISGNRCGTCLAYRPFNVYERKTFDIVEMPVYSARFSETTYEEGFPNKDFAMANATTNSLMLSNVLFEE